MVWHLNREYERAKTQRLYLEPKLLSTMCTAWVRIVVGRSGTQWDVVGRSGTQSDVVGRSGTQWDAVPRGGTQRDVAGRSGTQWDAVRCSGTCGRPRTLCAELPRDRFRRSGPQHFQPKMNFQQKMTNCQQFLQMDLRDVTWCSVLSNSVYRMNSKKV